eukprot:scaffold4899_cov98-Skeletonema_marinoi.AAC.2
MRPSCYGTETFKGVSKTEKMSRKLSTYNETMSAAGSFYPRATVMSCYFRNLCCACAMKYCNCSCSQLASAFTSVCLGRVVLAHVLTLVEMDVFDPF